MLFGLAAHLSAVTDTQYARGTHKMQHVLHLHVRQTQLVEQYLCQSRAQSSGHPTEDRTV